MAKTRKTKSQKFAADQRRQTAVKPPHSEPNTQPNVIHHHYSYTGAVSKKAPPVPATISTNSYGFVLHDLRKTLFLTLSIIVIQLLLFFLIQK